LSDSICYVHQNAIHRSPVLWSTASFCFCRILFNLVNVLWLISNYTLSSLSELHH
jgi:hypothetical protein